MIVREWRGRTASSPDRYIAHFRRSVLPELRGIDGFAGASLLTRRDGGEVEIVVLTRWRSLDAIRAFAGADPDRAVVEPEAVAALLRFDAAVRHYEVAEEVSV